MSDCENIELRIHGPPTAPTLVYLPGLHGDWTLVGGFRQALGPAVRFVETTYPRTVSWSLPDYARGVERALNRHGITHGWLLGESFGSQVLWEMLGLAGFDPEGVILAGGFARHPAPWLARWAAQLSGRAGFGVMQTLFRGYAGVSRLRFRRSPETLACIGAFLERRTREDCRAARHRLELVAANDPRPLVRQMRVPLYALTGAWDPIVPWRPTHRWLKRNCTTLCGHRTLWRADHNVLGAAPKQAAAQVLNWMTTAGRHDVQPGSSSPQS